MQRLLRCLTIITLAIIAMSATAKQHQALTPEQVDHVKKIVHQYMLEHPEILSKMAEKLRQQQQAQAEAEALKVIASKSKALFYDKHSPVLGNPKGQVILVEFMDYQCPHCKRMGAIVDRLIKKNSDLRVVIKELPIYNQTSHYAALAALAAQKQNQFESFHHALLKASNPLSKDKIHQIAKSIGLNVKQLKTAMENDVYHNEIQQNYALAQELGLQGTPTFIVATSGKNARFIPEATTYQQLQTTMNQLKQKNR